MNAIEIEEAVSKLIGEPFDPAGFPFAFLEAFGNKKATIDKLKKSNANKSDLERGVLQRNNIHVAVCSHGEVGRTLMELRSSPATEKFKAKFILATDGVAFEAEDLSSGDTLVCDYSDFPNKFAFFLPLAGISAIKQIKENSFDIRATSRLNKLYVELLKDNQDWASAERRADMNHFMARLIFCFFAEDTDIFRGDDLFTETVNRMSESNSSNTHEVIEHIFRSMDTPHNERVKAGIRSWADAFPYVNGGLFAGSTEAPRFSKIARSYLLHVGSLDWRQINPDIFGSMIQAIADDEERGELGMHYTSVPNILKVLNPLFLDDLNAALEAAGESPQKLLNLRKRISKIRIFDPACGSGNFLVIAYKQMRAIEAEINKRRNERDLRSAIPLTNFRGIEIRSFSAEVARLALIIAEYQCDFMYRGQKEALAEFLPLDTENWITCGNALRLDWLSICPPAGAGVQHRAEDLFHAPRDQAQVEFENEGGETYICGNPPYKGGTEQTVDQKADMASVFSSISNTWKSLDYIAGWFYKAADYARYSEAACAFVSTNSICQGEQVARLWPILFSMGQSIVFAHTSFKWSNLAAHNAGVTVIIVGLSSHSFNNSQIFETNADGVSISRVVANINAYLIGGNDVIVKSETNPISDLSEMVNGNKAVDGGHLVFDADMRREIVERDQRSEQFVRPYFGSADFIKGNARYCIWVTNDNLHEAVKLDAISERLEKVRDFRADSKKELTQKGAKTPHLFQQIRQTGKEQTFVIPRVSSERRPYIPVGLLPNGSILADSAFGMFDASIWCLSLMVSRLHLVWIATVCGQLETRLRYSNTLGWNTFPVPTLTEKNREDLTRCAEDILLAREAHFPKTIADLYDPESMPDNLREAHDRNDETLERIYIGRRFRNDTERLEKLFELYTKMTAGKAA